MVSRANVRDRVCSGCGATFRSDRRECSQCRTTLRMCACGHAFRSATQRQCHNCRAKDRQCTSCGAEFRGRYTQCGQCKARARAIAEAVALYVPRPRDPSE